MKRPTKSVLAFTVFASVACATAKGPFVPYAQTGGYHAIGTSVYGYLEKDLNGDGMPDVVLVRQDSKGGYRVQVMQRRDPAGETWSKTCDTDPVKGEDVHQITWLGDPSARQLVMLVVGEDNPEEVMQRFVVVNPDGCKVEWADMLTTPRRDTPVMRSSNMPPEGLSLAAEGNVLRLVDHTELVGLQGQEGPVGLLARYRERVGIMQDGHMTISENTQAVLRKRDVKVTWEPHILAAANAVAADANATVSVDPNAAPHAPVAAANAAAPVADANAAAHVPVTAAHASATAVNPVAHNPNDASAPPPAHASPDAEAQHLAELTDGKDDTAFILPPGLSGRLTIDSDDAFVLLEVHHGCDPGTDQGLILEHSGRAYTTGTAPTDHAPFRAAGRRHPRDKAYTQELLALHDALHAITLDLPKNDSVRCLREVSVYGWQ